MIITQNELIKQIAETEDIDVATVRNTFKAAENIIFDHLSSIKPSEKIVIGLLSGVSIERKYVPSKTYSKGLFDNIDCPEHVGVRAKISKYYKEKVNKILDAKNLLR